MHFWSTLDELIGVHRQYVGSRLNRCHGRAIGATESGKRDLIANNGGSQKYERSSTEPSLNAKARNLHAGPKLRSNPFDGLPASVRANKRRFRFVTADEAVKILDACPDGDARTIPLLPELLPRLHEAFETAEPGATHVITRYRSGNQNLRTQFSRIIRRAGLEPWPKPFQNL
jgi:hypothetical protein